MTDKCRCWFFHWSKFIWCIEVLLSIFLKKNVYYQVHSYSWIAFVYMFPYEVIQYHIMLNIFQFKYLFTFVCHVLFIFFFLEKDPVILKSPSWPSLLSAINTPLQPSQDCRSTLVKCLFGSFSIFLFRLITIQF